MFDYAVRFLIAAILIGMVFAFSVGLAVGAILFVTWN